MKEQGPAALWLEQVGKWYPGGVHAVQGVDLQVNPGEFLVFVGSSGCGKSTTLRMIAGLERVDEGMIYLDDRLLNGVAPKKEISLWCSKIMPCISLWMFGIIWRSR